MDTTLRFTLLFVLFLLLALTAVGCLVFFLRKLTVEYAQAEVPDKQHWWRYAVPSAAAIIFAFWQGRDGSILNFLYFFIACIGVPMGLAFFALRESLEKKTERLTMLAALLFFVNASIYGADWCWHFRGAHAEEIDAGTFENPHLTARNYYFIPLWVLTVIIGGAAGYLWRKESRKENDGLLPAYYAAA